MDENIIIAQEKTLDIKSDNFCQQYQQPPMQYQQPPFPFPTKQVMMITNAEDELTIHAFLNRLVAEEMKNNVNECCSKYDCKLRVFEKVSDALGLTWRFDIGERNKNYVRMNEKNYWLMDEIYSCFFGPSPPVPLLNAEETNLLNRVRSDLCVKKTDLAKYASVISKSRSSVANERRKIFMYHWLFGLDAPNQDPRKDGVENLACETFHRLNTENVDHNNSSIKTRRLHVEAVKMAYLAYEVKRNQVHHIPTTASLPATEQITAVSRCANNSEVSLDICDVFDAISAALENGSCPLEVTSTVTEDASNDERETANRRICREAATSQYLRTVGERLEEVRAWKKKQIENNSNNNTNSKKRILETKQQQDNLQQHQEAQQQREDQLLPIAYSTLENYLKDQNERVPTQQKRRKMETNKPEEGSYNEEENAVRSERETCRNIIDEVIMQTSEQKENLADELEVL